jgi:deoxyribonucleoside regulator
VHKNRDEITKIRYYCCKCLLNWSYSQESLTYATIKEEHQSGFFTLGGAIMSKNQQSTYDRAFLIEVAQLYYEKQLTQAEIGRRLNMSRSTISRMLHEARETGAVKITIDYSAAHDKDLEMRIQQHYNVQDIRVLRSFDRNDEDVRSGMGQLAANYLREIVQDRMVIGISSGRSIANTVRHFEMLHRADTTVVQVIGALGSDNPLIEGTDLARQLANKLNANYRYLHAPLMVEDPRTRDLLLQEPMVQDVISVGRQCDLAIFGIGALASDTSGLIWSGYVSRKELTWLQNKGAVGHMCAQVFDSNGQILDIEFNHRSISIGLHALKGIGTVVAIAGSRDKSAAILGALRGGYIDVLITDDQAALGILELIETEGI